MDDKRKDRPDRKRLPKRHRPQQLQTHNVPTDDVENTNSTNLGGYMINRELFLEEQKRPEVQENYYTLINTSSMRNKTRQKKLAMAWIDYKQTYDMIPQSWMIQCLKISGEVIKLIENTMKNWRVELTAGGKFLTEVKIQREIFQGDTPSPLLFVTAMILRKSTGGYEHHKSQEKKSTT